jgi:hypothetical protein
MDGSASGSCPTGGLIMKVIESSGSAARAEFNLLALFSACVVKQPSVFQLRRGCADIH